MQHPLKKQTNNDDGDPEVRKKSLKAWDFHMYSFDKQ